MASDGHDFYYDLPFLNQSQFDFSQDFFDESILNLEPIVEPNSHPTVFGWTDGPQGPPLDQWRDTPTVTNVSSVSTPLPAFENDGSDNDISRRTSSDSKRKLEELDQEDPTKRPRSDSGQADTTIRNRLTGACLCCQMRTNKHKCPPGPSPDGPCMPCYKKATSLAPALCHRARFQDVEIFRLGPSKDFANTLRWLQKGSTSTEDPQKALWKPISNIPAKKSRHSLQGYKTLRLSQGHTQDTLNLRVQEFDPTKDDKQNYTWFDKGTEHTYHCPPFAIADKDHAKEEIRRFINANMEAYINRLLPESQNLATAFVRRIFQTALDRAHECSLVKMALTFWVAGRLIEEPWCIRGEETLGMTPDALPSSPYYSKIPVTPIMDFQIDNVVIHDHLKRLLQNIRHSMREKIMPIKKEDWFDIHLTTFILLHHVDLTMRHDMDFAKQHNLAKRFSNKPLVDMITMGANTLLEYYQHEKGHYPLSAPTWHEVESSYMFDDTQKHHLLEVRKMLRQLDAPHIAGDDLFWTSQIHKNNWCPAVVQVA